jgi:hypothetical protein
VRNRTEAAMKALRLGAADTCYHRAREKEQWREAL